MSERSRSHVHCRVAIYIPATSKLPCWTRETREVLRRRLRHENAEARAFYASLPPGAIVEIEAIFPARWFERLLEETKHELWFGNGSTDPGRCSTPAEA
jgi:hypothetical protein